MKRLQKKSASTFFAKKMKIFKNSKVSKTICWYHESRHCASWYFSLRKVSCFFCKESSFAIKVVLQVDVNEYFRCDKSIFFLISFLNVQMRFRKKISNIQNTLTSFSSFLFYLFLYLFYFIYSFFPVSFVSMLIEVPITK